MSPAHRVSACRLTPLGMAIAGLLSLFFSNSLAQEAPLRPPPMALENRFTTPQEVVRHYVERDRWGYVWSGLNHAERMALTAWMAAPLPQTAFLIRGYEIVEPIKLAGDQARVEVLYKVHAYTDGRGTLLPFTGNTKRIIFELKRSRGQWRIEGPPPQELPAFVDPERYPLPLPEKVSDTRS